MGFEGEKHHAVMEKLKGKHASYMLERKVNK